MKIKKSNINIYIFLLSFLTVESGITFSAPNTKKSSVRKASSKSTSKSSRSLKARSSTVSTATSNQNIITQTVSSDNTENEINEDNCEFHYNLCMNNICNDASIGKCVCYEDKYTNTTNQSFINIDGNNVKKGFELFEYAKKQCLYILDKCMNVRRSVTEKYKNSIQRDCLMVSQTEVTKNQGLSGELEELKSCIYNHCTASNMGQEDFSMPAYGLCFDPVVAKFQLDTNCISIIGKSKTPAGLRELFMNDMTRLREEACKKMNGEMSTDRQKCYVNVSYGINKDTISATKKIAVGEFFSCNGEEFDTEIGLSQDYLRNQKYRKMHLAAQNLRAAGNVVGVVVGESSIGFIVEKSIDATASIANVAVDIKKASDGHLSKEQLAQNLANELNFTGLNILQTVSIAKGISDEISSKKAKETKLAKNTEYSKNTGGCSKIHENDGETPLSTDNTTSSKSKKVDTGGCSRAYENDKAKNESYQNASKALAIASSAVGAASAITDYAMTEKIDSINIENEKKGIKQHSTFENRDEGVGQVNKTASNRGNCFVNGEWFATENELILLQWKL
ncbi:MAG: hypothetical protein ACI4N3_02615 [Alphaproteobacteria bacterium]